MQRAQEDHLTGTVLEGRYTVGHRMARGGTGGVYRAIDTRLDRTVAVKIMHPHLTEDPDFVGRFAREARAAAQLSHPNVVAVLDQATTDDGLVFLVMEYVEGGTLRDVLNRKRFLTPGQAIEVLAPILDGLASAHGAGLVHRDIKPENVLMRTDATVKVADFGLSRGADQHTTTGAVLGTVAYAAPELVREEHVGTRSDVYSVGILAWEMLAGKRPFQGSPWMMARAHVEEIVPALTTVVPGIPQDVSDVVASWTAKDADERPESARDMVTQVARLRAGLDESARGHVPAGWEQGPGPVAPVLADPGASVLPDSAPATGPVEELRSSGPLTRESELIGDPDSGDRGSGHGDAGDHAAEDEKEPGASSLATEAISVDDQRVADEAATEAITPASRDSKDSPAAADSQMTETLSAASAQGPRPSFRELGVFDDTTDITELNTASTTDAHPEPNTPSHARAGQGAGQVPGARSGSTSTSARAGSGSRSADQAGGDSLWGRVSHRILGGDATATDANGALLEDDPVDPAKPTVRLTGSSPIRVVLAVALTALIVSLAGFLGWLLGSGSFRAEAIPTVQGTSTEQAQVLVEEQGFSNVRVYEQASSEIPEGSVIGTQPGEGTQMRVGEQLSILVSTGPEQVNVPSIEGLAQDEATSRLDNAGLATGSVTTEFSDDVAEGEVISVSPAAGTQVDEGSSVDLTVSEGSEPTDVPNTVGSNIDDATAELEDLGFTVEREDVAGGYLGRVISQSQDGSTITLRVI